MCNLSKHLGSKKLFLLLLFTFILCIYVFVCLFVFIAISYVCLYYFVCLYVECFTLRGWLENPFCFLWSLWHISLLGYSFLLSSHCILHVFLFFSLNYHVFFICNGKKCNKRPRLSEIIISNCNRIHAVTWQDFLFFCSSACSFFAAMLQYLANTCTADVRQLLTQMG